MLEQEKNDSRMWGANSDIEESTVPPVKSVRKVLASSVVENTLPLISVVVAARLAGIYR